MAFVAVVPAVGGAIATGVGAIGAGLASGLGAIGGLASSIPVVGGVLGPAVSGLGGMVGSLGSGLAGGIGGLAAGNVGGAISSLGSGLLGAGGNLVSGLGGMYTGVDKMVGGILPNIGSAGVTPNFMPPPAPAGGGAPLGNAGGGGLGEVAGMPTGGGAPESGLGGIANKLSTIGKIGQKLGMGNLPAQPGGGVGQQSVQTRQITTPQTQVVRMGQNNGNPGPRQLGATVQAAVAAGGAGGGSPAAYQNKIGEQGKVKGYNQYAEGTQYANTAPTLEDTLKAQQIAAAQNASLNATQGGRLTSMPR